MKPYFFKYLGVALLSLVSLTTLRAETDSAYWFAISAPKFEYSNAKAYFTTEFRSTEFDRVDYYYMAFKNHWKLNDSWTLGTTPVWERSRSGDGWKDKYRFDLELNPAKFKLWEDGPTVGLLNRWEFALKEGKGHKVYHRIRLGQTLSWKLNQDSWLTGYSISNHVFYELDKEKWTMVRFYPASLTLKANSAFTPSIYYMYQYKRAGTSGDWNGTHVFGMKAKF